MKLLTVGAIAILGLTSHSALAAHAHSRDLDQLDVERSAALERLVKKGTADSLTAAAVLKQFGANTDSGSYSLLSRAVELDPKRADLAWLAVRLCNIAADCDAAGPEKHLREIDPGNGIGLIGALTSAQRKNDVAAIDSALTAIAGSDHFYVYFDPLVAATAPELAAARHGGAGQPFGKELARATADMIGVIAASVLPPSQSFSYSCQGMVLEQVSGRLERCRKAAQAFERADAFIVEGLGLSLQQRLWPLDSAEGRAITAKRRVFQYRLEEYSRLSISASKVDEIPPDLVEVFRSHEREQDAALVYFARAGVPADPPADWTSTSLPRVP
jgi:hypothetical protein